MEYAYGIAVDNDGNVITCGTFFNVVDFDPSEDGEALFTAIGANNGYVSKLDAAGNFVWARSVEGECFIMDVHTDNEGNVYCSGSFRNTIDFAAGKQSVLLSTNGLMDAFLAKYSSNGDLLWVFSLGADYHDSIVNISMDGDNNLLVCGYFSQTVDFDPGNAVNELTETGGINYQDAFVANYDSDGNFIWARQFSGDHNQYATGVESNSEGDIIIAGYYTTNIDCDPGPDELIFPSGGTLDWESYIVKLNASGDLMWAKSFGGTGQDAIYGPIALDEQDNIYTTGYFGLTADFDPGSDTFEMTAPGFVYDAFVAKTDTDGNFVWAKQMTGAGDMAGQAIDVLDGLVYTTGYVEGECDFDPGNGIAAIGLHGAYDIYFSVLSADGEYIWADRIGANEDDMGFAIVANEQYIYGTGFFRYNYATFGTEYLFAHGQNDSYVVKLMHPASNSVEDWHDYFIELYPNPTTDLLYFKGISSRATVLVTDISGKTVLIENYMKNAVLDISTLDAGVYTIVISDNGKRLSRKVVKQ